MKKILLISLLLVVQGCATIGADRNARLFNFFEVYSGECQYAYAIDDDVTSICEDRFVHAQNKRGIYFFAYYFEGNVQIVMAGAQEATKDDNIYLNVESVSIVAEGQPSEDVQAIGKCGIVYKDNKRYSVCQVDANGKRLEFRFLITERVR